MYKRLPPFTVAYWVNCYVTPGCTFDPLDVTERRKSRSISDHHWASDLSCHNPVTAQNSVRWELTARIAVAEVTYKLKLRG